MKYERNFPDYAERWMEKVGTPLTDLVATGKTNDEIREEFHKVGLKRPSRAFLDYYRSMFSDPGELAKRINHEFLDFIASKLGAKLIKSTNLLDAIIIQGFQNLKSIQSVTVQEMLKAIELKEKLQGGAGIEEVQEQLEKMIRESKENGRKKEPDIPENRVYPNRTGAGDTRN